MRRRLHFDTTELEQQAAPRQGPSLRGLRATLIATIAALGAAALVHIVRYVLMIINRDVLLNPVVAWLATWLGVVISVAVVFLVVATFILLTNWLIARRAAAFPSAIRLSCYAALTTHRNVCSPCAGRC